METTLARKRVVFGRFVATLIHFNEGWRYWARSSVARGAPDRHDCDTFYGLSPKGYATKADAFRAMRRAEVQADALEAEALADAQKRDV